MSTVKDLKDKLVLKLSELLPASIIEDVKKLNEAEKTNVKLAQYNTTDGAVVSIDGEPMVGAAINIVAADGTMSKAEGTFTLETGEVIIAVGGFITEVQEEPSDAGQGNPPANTTPDATAQMKAEMEKQGAELKDLKTKYEQVVKHNTDLAAALKKILETPIEVKQSKHVEKVDLSKMSALERRQYLRENEQ